MNLGCLNRLPRGCNCEAREGSRPHIQRLLTLGTGDHRPVQDLREVNCRTLDIHPTVPNPYHLLSALPLTHVWYSVLDLKVAFFFCLRLRPQSQPLCALERRDPERGNDPIVKGNQMADETAKQAALSSEILPLAEAPTSSED